MTDSFNLLDEPWIRVTRLDGSPEEVSLLTVFREATSIGGIHGEIASQDVAILRLLLAICHRTMGGPEDLDTWEAYWEDPELLGRDATAYLERHRDRFDLRHPEHPFFQVAGIKSASRSTEFHGLDELIVDLPKEGKRLFTTRDGSMISYITCAEAARWLIHLHAYDIAGIHTAAVGDTRAKANKSYGIGTGWAGQIGVVTIQGDDLHRMLLLNTVVTSLVPGLREVDVDADLPPWERDPDTSAGRSPSAPIGPVSSFTWQARRALLYGTNDQITHLFFTNGDEIDSEDGFLNEPLSAWRKVKNSRKFVPYTFRSEQAFWRGLPSLLPQLHRDSTKAYRQPGVISFYQILISKDIVPNRGIVPVRGTGVEYSGDKSVVRDLIDDTLRLPASLLEPGHERLVTVVGDAMEEAEQVAKALRNLGGKLARAQGAEPDRVKAAGKQAGAAFYLAIDEEFPRWLASLETTGPQEGREQWRRLILRQAWAQGEEMANAAPASAIAGRQVKDKDKDKDEHIDVGRALMRFDKDLRRIIPHEAIAGSGPAA